MDELQSALDKLSALSQIIRLKTFRLLMAELPNGLAAGTISKTLGVAPNKLTAHLNILSASDLISARREGRNMIYSANTAAVSVLLNELVETCCHNNPDVCENLILRKQTEDCC
ncbi:MAG: transcriptional regulator [Ponticaulis sp.]|nr:transcriptional regulator [Ponticaulis sp.]